MTIITECNGSHRMVERRQLRSAYESVLKEEGRRGRRVGVEGGYNIGRNKWMYEGWNREGRRKEENE